MAVGIAAIAVMLFLPGGLMGLADRLRSRLQEVRRP
jgi:ABC-type branched-subunit amino acid transport system permease subunit